MECFSESGNFLSFLCNSKIVAFPYLFVSVVLDLDFSFSSDGLSTQCLYNKTINIRNIYKTLFLIVGEKNEEFSSSWWGIPKMNDHTPWNYYLHPLKHYLRQRFLSGSQWVEYSLQRSFIWTTQFLKCLSRLPRFQNQHISHKNLGLWLLFKKKKSLWKHEACISTWQQVFGSKEQLPHCVAGK